MTIRKKAERMGISVSKLMVSAALNYRGGKKNGE